LYTAIVGDLDENRAGLRRAGNRRRRAAITLVFAVTILALGRPARADDDEDARLAMRRGVAAFGRGDAEQAIIEYESAKRLAPAANAPYRYAAEALASLGRWPEAVTNLEGYLAKNPAVSDASEVRERIAKIRAEHFAAHARIVADAPDAVMTVDGEAKGPPAVIDLAPGKHRIEVTAPGRIAAAQDVTLIGDREATFVFALTTDPGPPQVPVVPPTERPRDAGPWQTIGWASAGVGVATLVTTFIVDAAVLGPKLSDYRDAADRGDVGARALHDDASSLRSGVVVGYVVGIVLTLAGTGLVLLAPKAAPTAVLRHFVRR
jgi:tetratricopeptide (TPR) repeat protein